MRGEHASSAVVPVMPRGSSPHARGTPYGLPALILSGGIIPACAGNTKPAPLTTIYCSGSSPHARGTLKAANHRGREVGIIPACAGNTLASGANPNS